jgi:CubicO group peptidase (beta-lactamase class C family)
MKKIILSGVLFPLTLILLLSLYSSGTSKVNEPADVILSEFYQNTLAGGLTFRKWLRQNIDFNTVPSVSVGIVFKDRLIFNDGLNADIDTRFDIASLTKTFTAILVLQLAEEGHFKIDDPIKKILPDLFIEGYIVSRPATIRHLLSHTSGINSFGRITLPGSKKDVYYARQYFPAGAAYSYSNMGFVLLKHMIETITRHSYADELKKRILDPLEMKSTTGMYSNGTGGIMTTLRDLSHYTSMLIQKGKWKDNELLSESSFNQMLVPVARLSNGGRDNGFISLSWEITSTEKTVESFCKAGRWFGAASFLEVFPGKNTALLFLCNPPNHQSMDFLSWRSRLTARLIQFIKDISVTQSSISGGPGIYSSIPDVSVKTDSRLVQ